MVSKIPVINRLTISKKMKTTKILAVALAALTMTACSDDDDFNTASDVTVEMEETQILAKESTKMIYVPVVVKGEANGPICVTVEMTAPASDYDAAQEDKDYIVTSKTVNIPKGVESVSIELYPKWEKGVINDDIAFDVTISKADGAQIGELKSTEVVIRDSDKDPYNILTGVWTYSEYSFADQAENSYNVSIEQPDEFIKNEETGKNEPNPEYGYVLYMYGYSQYGFMYLPLDYNYNEDTKEVKLSIPMNSLMCTGPINFGNFLGVMYTSIYNGNNPIKKGSVELVVSSDLKSIEMAEPNTMIQSSIYTTTESTFPAQGAYAGYWDVFGYVTLTR